MNLTEQGFTWAYCFLCESLELICPKCKKTSCCGGGCEFCDEIFNEINNNHKDFIETHSFEIPDTISVVGRGVVNLIER